MARFNKLLRIHLSSRTYSAEDIPREVSLRFLGGKGLGTYYLCKELAAGIDPLSPDNKMIIALGPLNGTTAPASSRFEIVTKSPLTGIYLDCNSGGHFGAELKAAGYDCVILEGLSPKPVVVFIENDSVRFIDAAGLWGKNVYETETAVRALVKNREVRVLSIGPAGENLVRFASLSNDYSRNAARGGSGAVLGSKRVKAIAVRGTRDIPLADMNAFQTVAGKAKQVIFSNPWVPDQRKYGTPRSVEPVNENGLMPVDNFTAGRADSVKAIDARAYEPLIHTRLSCGECPVACSKGYKQGPVELEGPEFETIGLFGPNLGIYDPMEIAELNYLCNTYGLDTITAGSLIGAVIAEGKYLGHENEGRAKTVGKLLEMITYRRGLGDLLAEGPAKAGAVLGISERMPHVKGMGFPAYDPRCSPGTALVYMTADRGACHLRSWPLGRELSGMWKEDDILGRVRFVKEQQDEKAAEEGLIVCQFVYGIGLLDPVLAELVSAATGEPWTMDLLKASGERTWNLARLFNLREGLSRKDDYLPEKFGREGITAGPLKGRRISRDEQDFMLDSYYSYRGWDSDGKPLEETIRRLGIGGVL